MHSTQQEENDSDGGTSENLVKIYMIKNVQF